MQMTIQIFCTFRSAKCIFCVKILKYIKAKYIIKRDKLNVLPIQHKQSFRKLLGKNYTSLYAIQDCDVTANKMHYHNLCRKNYTQELFEEDILRHQCYKSW